MSRHVASTRFSKCSRGIARMLCRRPSTQQLIAAIRDHVSGLSQVADKELAAKISLLSSRVRNGESPTLPSILIEAFALTTEALKRTTSMVYYDVQLAGGIGMADGAVVEMQTGEGKTIVIALPAVLHALTGQGVHVATTNHYLASRDQEQLSPVFEMLGIHSEILPEDSDLRQSQTAYRADVTYGTGYQFGFDYLKDQLELRHHENIGRGTDVLLHLIRQERQVSIRQRGREFTIIDEIDSVMLDEANTPLLLSGSSNQNPTPFSFQVAHQTAVDCIVDEHYVLDTQKGSVEITQSGEDFVLNVHEQNSHMELSRPWISYIYNALRAVNLFVRDEDYVVRDGKVQIVDAMTGRIHPDRTWRDGLHQAIEAKENVTISPPNVTQARITRQRYRVCLCTILCNQRIISPSSLAILSLRFVRDWNCNSERLATNLAM